MPGGGVAAGCAAVGGGGAVGVQRGDAPPGAGVAGRRGGQVPGVGRVDDAVPADLGRGGGLAGHADHGTVMVTSAARLGPASAPGGPPWPLPPGPLADRATGPPAGTAAWTAATRVRRRFLPGRCPAGRPWPASRPGPGRARRGWCGVLAAGPGRRGRGALPGCRGSRRRAGPAPAAPHAARRRAPHRRAVPGRSSRRSRTAPGTSARTRSAARRPSAGPPRRGPGPGPAGAPPTAVSRTSAPPPSRPAPHQRSPRRAADRTWVSSSMIRRCTGCSEPAYSAARHRGSRAATAVA